MIEISGSLHSPPLKRISSSKSNERENQATAKQSIRYKLNILHESFSETRTNNPDELLHPVLDLDHPNISLILLNQSLFNITSINFQFNNTY